ncbi:hypothetical protein ACNHYB_13910 [Isoptericola jiangsuensis]|uniref:hypothetical protein n=1 Tax=Isoptericola jiangsuensis TaxID=548579 RepID=UPI003AAAFABC
MSKQPTSGDARPGGARRWIAGAMVVITTLLVIGSSVAVWAHRTVFDTDEFMQTVEPALDDPALYEALADNVSEQALLALDLDSRVSERLTQLDGVLAATLAERLDVEPGPLLEALTTRIDRPSLAALTPTVVGPVEDRIDTVIHRFFAREEFQDRVPQIVARAHEAAIGLARAEGDDYPNVYLTDDAVVLNTVPLISEALQESLAGLGDLLPDVELPDAVAEQAPEARAQLGDALGRQLPEDFGQVELLDRETFEIVQDTVTTVDRVVWLLVALTVLAIVVTLWVSPQRRRTAAQLGIGVLAALVIVWALIGQLRNLVVDVAVTPDGQHVAGSLFDAVSGEVRVIFLLVGLVAAVTVVLAVLSAHGPRWAEQAGRRWPWVRQVTDADGSAARWVGANADALRVAVLVVAVLVIVLAGFHWAAILVVVVGGAAALWGIAVARRTAAVPGRRRVDPETAGPVPDTQPVATGPGDDVTDSAAGRTPRSE